MNLFYESKAFVHIPLKRMKIYNFDISFSYRFIYIMYGMRYLSIVDSRFVKIALGLAWILPLLMTISSYFGFKDEVRFQETSIKD